MEETTFQKNLVRIPNKTSSFDETDEIISEIQHLNVILDAKLDSVTSYMEIAKVHTDAIYKQVAETTDRINKLCKDLRWKV